MIKVLTKEDLEQSIVPPARKGDVLIRGNTRWVLPYDLIWRRNARWPAHQGYWSLALPRYRYGVVSEGDRIEVADGVPLYFPYPEKTEWHHRLETPDFDTHKGDWHVCFVGVDGTVQRVDGRWAIPTHEAASEAARSMNKDQAERSEAKRA